MKLSEQERDLWLLVIGGALASPEFRAGCERVLSEQGAPTDSLRDLIHAVVFQQEQREYHPPSGKELTGPQIARGWVAANYGRKCEADESTIDAMLKRLAELIEKRQMRTEATKLRAAAALGSQDEYKRLLHGVAERLQLPNQPDADWGEI